MTTRDLSPRVLAGLVLNTDPYLSCEECFDQVDEMVEALLESGRPLSAEFGVHLRGCGACHEEAQTLATLVAPEFGLDPEDALARLERAVADA